MSQSLHIAHSFINHVKIVKILNCDNTVSYHYRGRFEDIQHILYRNPHPSEQALSLSLLWSLLQKDPSGPPRSQSEAIVSSYVSSSSHVTLHVFVRF